MKASVRRHNFSQLSALSQWHISYTMLMRVPKTLARNIKSLSGNSIILEHFYQVSWSAPAWCSNSSSTGKRSVSQESANGPQSYTWLFSASSLSCGSTSASPFTSIRTRDSTCAQTKRHPTCLFTTSASCNSCHLGFSASSSWRQRRSSACE